MEQFLKTSKHILYCILVWFGIVALPYLAYYVAIHMAIDFAEVADTLEDGGVRVFMYLGAWGTLLWIGVYGTGKLSHMIYSAWDQGLKIVTYAYQSGSG